MLILNKPVDFYVKWAATSTALLHVYLTAHDIAPFYKFSGFFDCFLWLWLGFLWKQPSIIILNIIMIGIFIHGFIV